MNGLINMKYSTGPGSDDTFVKSDTLETCRQEKDVIGVQ